MQKLFIPLLVLVGIASLGFVFFKSQQKQIEGTIPALTPINQEKVLKEAKDETNLGLTIPPGYRISIFADGLGEPRDLEFDPNGNLLVSVTSKGRVVALANGETRTVLDGLNLPHGLAFRQGKLYVAETNQVAIYDYDQSTFKASNKKKIIDLPSGGGHFTRSLLFTPDDKLLVSIGSSCNVCVESDKRRASIWIANPDGTDFKFFATGLRNSVFMTLKPGTNEIWATEMGRDLLGDDIPPDEVNIIRFGSNYGWPICYGNKVHDSNFDKGEGGYLENPCGVAASPVYNIQAHSAPLGLAFLGNDLLVSFHGSWNRSVPTGYKVVRFVEGKQEDFITGWLQNGVAKGRPVDILIDKVGKIYISDDKLGVIYLLERI